MWTVAPAMKSVPLIVTDVPPAAAPDAGLIANGIRCENSDVLPEGSVAVDVDAQIDADAVSQVTESVVMNRVAPNRDVGLSGVVDHAAAAVVRDHVAFAGSDASDGGAVGGCAKAVVAVRNRHRPGCVG